MYFHPRFIYSKVSTADDIKSEEDFVYSPHPPFQTHSAEVVRRLKWALVCSVLVSLTSLALAAASVFKPASLVSTVSSTTPSSVHGSEPLDSTAASVRPKPAYSCGNSSATALANDCVFDALTVSWQPRSCSTAYISEYLDYASERPYQYFSDQEGTQLLSHEELTKPDEVWYWSTKREHLAHCAFVLLRFYDAVEKGERIDSIAGNPHHAKHCVKNMLKAMESGAGWDEINTTGNVQFLTC